MIAQLRGRLASKEPHRVVVDVGGVGYLVLIPLSTFYRLPEIPAEVMLHTFTHVREDAIQLFGFHTRDEQTLFELLQGVSGIGPRLATNILSGISVEDLTAALSPWKLLAYGCGELYTLHWRAENSEQRAAWTQQVAVARSRGQGLLVNPHYQDHRILQGRVPLPLWGGTA